MRASLPATRSSSLVGILAGPSCLRRGAKYSIIVVSGADETRLMKLVHQVKPTGNSSLKNSMRIAIRQPQPRHTIKDPAPDAPVSLIHAVDITASGAEGDAWCNFLLDNCNAENKMVACITARTDGALATGC